MSYKTVQVPYVMFAQGPDRYTTGTDVTLSFQDGEYVLTLDSGNIAAQVPLTPHDMAILLSCVEGEDAA